MIWCYYDHLLIVLMKIKKTGLPALMYCDIWYSEHCSQVHCFGTKHFELYLIKEHAIRLVRSNCFLVVKALQVPARLCTSGNMCCEINCIQRARRGVPLLSGSGCTSGGREKISATFLRRFDEEKEFISFHDAKTRTSSFYNWFISHDGSLFYNIFFVSNMTFQKKKDSALSSKSLKLVFLKNVCRQ